MFGKLKALCDLSLQDINREFMPTTATMHPLRLNPPNEKNSLHMMSPPFVVRPLPGAGLDGAFRVHLSPESLDHLGLKVGELCQITGENGGIGYGASTGISKTCHTPIASGAPSRAPPDGLARKPFLWDECLWLTFVQASLGERQTRWAIVPSYVQQR